MQNQHTKKLISARKTSNKDNNKDIWHANEFKLHKRHLPLVEVMYLVFTRMPVESCRRRLIFFLLLCLCDVFRALINSLLC